MDGLEVLFNATHIFGTRPDFADIRFVNGNGTTVPHRTVAVTRRSHAYVWLAISANATAITIIYGNPAAHDTSDPDAIFLSYEDYECGGLSR